MKDDMGAVMLASVVLLWFIYLSYRRNEVWRGGGLSLWQESTFYSPNYLRPHLNLGTALAEAGRVDESLTQDWWIINHAPTAPMYQHPREMLLAAEANAASLLIHLGDDAAPIDPSKSWSYYQEAAHILTRAWAESPGSPYIGLHLAALANVAGRPDAALDILDQSLTMFPSDGPPYVLSALYWSKGVILQRLHNCAAASGLFGLARNVDPDMLHKPIPDC